MVAIMANTETTVSKSGITSVKLGHRKHVLSQIAELKKERYIVWWLKQ